MGVDDVTDPERLFTAPHVNQQCTFFRMDVVREVGLLDERLHCVMDYELWLQVLLRKGTQGLRGVPVLEKHRPLVRSMAVAFLLKWHYTIFSERDFRMMRQFRDLGIGTGPLDAERRSQLARLDEQLRSRNWTLFRARRKWKHFWS